MIAKEVIRIDVDLLDDAAQSQLNDTPIMPGRAAAAALPIRASGGLRSIIAVGNIEGAASHERFQQIFLLGEEFVVGEKCNAADALGREIDETRRRYRC